MRARIQSGTGLKHMVLLRPFFSRLARAAASENGDSLVEFAMAATIFFTVMFAIMNFSLVMYAYSYLADSAREATRYAMVRGSTWVNNGGADCASPGPANCTAQTADIQTFVRNFGIPGLNSNNITVTSTWLTASGAACGATDACKPPGNQVRITVSYSYTVSIPLVPQQTFAMSSTSQMVVAQ